MNVMTFQQAATITKEAKRRGLAARVQAGKIQIVRVTFDVHGVSAVMPVTGWLTFDEAKKWADSI